MRQKCNNASNDYIRIRAALLDRGFTLASFARKCGVNRQTAYSSAKGHRNGVKSAAFRRQLEEFLHA